MALDLVNQALASLREKNYATARTFMRAYAEQGSAFEFQHYLIKGLSEIALKEWVDAIATFSEAVERFPHQPQLWLNLGVALENYNDLDAAADSYEHCLDLKPDQADAAGNLSNIYRRRGRYAEAEAMAHRSFENGAPKAQVLNSLALAVARQGRIDAANSLLAEAQQLAPEDGQITTNLANLAVDELKFDEAWPLFSKARSLSNDPMIVYQEGLARLLAGDYAEGWRLSEARIDLPTSLRVRPQCPHWQGEILNGKTIILVAEQGYGDAIQFCRYGSLLSAQGAHVVWVVREPLRRLFAANLRGRIVIEGDDLPPADFWLPMMSLPLALGLTRPEDLPVAGYLKAGESDIIIKSGKNSKKIGLVWMGSPTHERDYERSMSLVDFEPLLKQVSATFYAPTAHFEGEAVPASFGTIQPLPEDFADMASVFDGFDALITVDTAAAHLAGALGLKTYLLLPYCPDWRWGVSGTTTLWYPSITILRQPGAGDWGRVIDALVIRLSTQFATG
jgi:tetratricopeptide (TPR) repeat protein